MTSERQAREKVDAGEMNCVCLGNEQILFESNAAGIAPLAEAAERFHPGEIDFAADKVIGKAAAGILVFLRVPRVYGALVSAPALGFLRRHGVIAEYGALTEAIQNRSGDGLCPMEARTLPLDSAEQIVASVRQMRARAEARGAAPANPA